MKMTEIVERGFSIDNNGKVLDDFGNEYRNENGEIEFLAEWEKLDDGEFTRKIKDRVFLLRKTSYGVLCIGRAYQLYTKKEDESELEYVSSIAYLSDNHGLKLHKDLPEDFDVYKQMNIIFEIADNYINKLY